MTIPAPIAAAASTAPTLLWDWGTAYDFFISLRVLHHPDRFGLRGAWARGVRSRLTPEVRATLEETLSVMKVPFPWLFGLDGPKDSQAILARLAAMSPAERLPCLALSAEIPPTVQAVLQAVAARGAWTEADRQALAAAYPQQSAEVSREIEANLHWWARPVEFGERMLQALQVYSDVFFAEEEGRIRPALAAAVDRGRQLAEILPLRDLLEELSQGLRFEEPMRRARLALIPSFWVSPLAIISHIHADTDLLVFGGRPVEDSLVPGEAVPDGLFQPLKALADPTRLRILRYLAESPLTPTDLARRLRLRAPTVIHHLNTLRLAGLVYLSVQPQGEKRYAARLSRVRAMTEQLNLFLGQPGAAKEDH